MRYTNSRRGYKNPTGYFHSHERNEAYNTISKMHDAMVSALTPSMDEEMCRQLIGDVPKGYNHSFVLYWEPKDVRLRCHVSKAANYDVQYFFNPDTDPRLIDQISTFVDHRREIMKDYGRLQAVVKKFMSGDYYTKKEVRYFFPSILALLRTAGLEELSKPRRDTSMDRPFRLAVGKAGLTVASGVMFKDMRFNEDVRVKLMGYDDAFHYEEGFEFRDYSVYY